MLYSSPQYTDDLILSGVKRQLGPAVSDPSQIAAAHNASQATKTAANEQAGKRLGLAKEQFDKQMAFTKDRDKWAKNQGNISTAVSGLGLGASLYSKNQANQQATERMNARNDLIKQMQASGDSNSLYFAKLLSLLSVK